MECIKMLQDLSIISKTLEIRFLLHLFKNFDPESSKCWTATVTHFHLRDPAESADYRSAYHQLCDWFYGWSVADTSSGTGGQAGAVGGNIGPGGNKGGEDEFPLGNSSSHLDLRPTKSAWGVGTEKVKKESTTTAKPAPAWATTRTPREIDILDQNERAECERMLKTFETLFHQSRRVLNRYYLEIEESIPRLGQGLRTLSNVGHAKGKRTGGRRDGDMESNDSHLDLIEEKERGDSIWGTPSDENQKGSTDDLEIEGENEFEDGSVPELSKNGDKNETSRRKHGDEIEDLTKKIGYSLASLDDFSPKPEEGVVVKKKKIQSQPKSKRIAGSKDALDGQKQEANPTQEEKSETAADGDKKTRALSTIATLSEETEPHQLTDTTKEGDYQLLAHNEIKNPLPTAPFSLMKQPNVQAKHGFFHPRNQQIFTNDKEARQALQRDINHVYIEIDRTTDYSLLCGVMLLTVLGFSELLGKKEIFKKYLGYMHEISQGFVSSTMKATWDLLRKELDPDQVQLADLRDPNALRMKIRQILLLRLKPANGPDTENVPSTNENAANNQNSAAAPSRLPRYRIRKLYQKFQLLHTVFTAGDIHVLPRFVYAHAEGTKSAQFSMYNSSLWLTSGYDGVIRIHDLRSDVFASKPQKAAPRKTADNQNNNSNALVSGGLATNSGFEFEGTLHRIPSKFCIAQFVGHKSIVTDAHFTRNDTLVVSCSFDHTLKIWNAQTGNCDRTLTGHSDSVTSCHITPDGRYIASGSLDCSVRLWDLSSGDCLTVIKKHTRWVKVVRFSSHDGSGRYLFTAAMDRRIYMWDTKLLVNARGNVTHTRCFESHTDTILDIALARPSLLLSTSRDGTVRLFDYMNGHELHCINIGPSWACTVTFSNVLPNPGPNATTINPDANNAGDSKKRPTVTFDDQPESGSVNINMGGPSGSKGQTSSYTGAPEYFATGSHDNNVLIFKTTTGDCVRQIRCFNLGILAVRFPVDLSYLVIGTTEGFLQQIPL
ncbi:hypothetical protein HK102_001722 [Quaeritorhiza haematococci]|nr:hypothetical protein HK102_001722 [Quaeritorhiza haematococci]